MLLFLVISSLFSSTVGASFSIVNVSTFPSDLIFFSSIGVFVTTCGESLDDSVIAGTALNKNNNNSGDSAADTVLNKILKAIEAGGDVYLDGDKVGMTQAKSITLFS